MKTILGQDQRQRVLVLVLALVSSEVEVEVWVISASWLLISSLVTVIQEGFGLLVSPWHSS